MIRPLLVAALAALPLTACKFIKNTDIADAAPQDDASRMAALAEADWTARALPSFEQVAAPAPEVLGMIAGDFAAAEARYGIGGGEGAPTNFVVRGAGTVVEANTESRAATLGIDIDGDGGADATVQLGPVIRGTALRDTLSFYAFSDFRDQIEFAKLARALNDLAYRALPAPPGDPVGRGVGFTGAFTLDSADAEIRIVPSTLQWIDE